jgi:hypothetical protein
MKSTKLGSTPALTALERSARGCVGVELVRAEETRPSLPALVRLTDQCATCASPAEGART